MEGGTQLNVTGLIPFFSYTFSVMTENSVSWQDTNTGARTTSVTIKTLEGGRCLLCTPLECFLPTCAYTNLTKNLTMMFKSFKVCFLLKSYTVYTTLVHFENCIYTNALTLASIMFCRASLAQYSQHTCGSVRSDMQSVIFQPNNSYSTAESGVVHV